MRTSKLKEDAKISKWLKTTKNNSNFNLNKENGK
jgi:hypothetical protein